MFLYKCIFSDYQHNLVLCSNQFKIKFASVVDLIQHYHECTSLIDGTKNHIDLPFVQIDLLSSIWTQKLTLLDESNDTKKPGKSCFQAKNLSRFVNFYCLSFTKTLLSPTHCDTITSKSRLTQKKCSKKTDAIFSIYGTNGIIPWHFF